ncbi:hypothetical protein [Microscilla marina]|uniref:Uncharacterized protein n=1 Tax=Microscilla marina ATCC 23134 TaxID=313606 RepID=A1ZSA6_MICM2|nr:hypothetical protein [Microscilla marina]EAY26654.1 hypothetical protein M23134_02905 [Microscilla marina ATCC 23134]
MKLNTKHLFFSLAIVFTGLFLAQTNAHAQAMKPWSWKKYKIKWKMPSNWNAKDKGGRSGKFTAAGGGVSFRLKPWRDASASAKQVAMRAYRGATSVQRKRIISQQYMTSKGGLKKYMILAEGWQKGKKVRIGIMGFINPKSPINLYCRFLWWASQDSKNNPISYRVAQSFSAM